MNLRWLWFDDIPPELNLTKKQRRLLRKRIRLHYSPARSRIFVTFLIVGAGYFGARLFVDYMIIPLLSPKVASVFETVEILLLPWAMWIVVAIMLRKPAAVAARAALVDIGYRLCRRCGYWLRAHDCAATCPECGERNYDRPRKLNMRDLGDPEIVTTIQQLGYRVCLHCGLLTFDGNDSCPECGKAIATAVKKK
jgi:RNA polymerase subunit RPABC4/transcription elongation factor Spt4